MRFLPSFFLCAVLSVFLSSAQTAPQIRREESKPLVTEGQVRSYESGKSLEIGVRPMVAHTFDLSSPSARYVGSSDIKVGSKVKVTESRSETGQKIIDVRVKP